MDCKIIVNPSAGKGKAGRELPRLKGLLDALGINYSLELTKCAGHATELARLGVQEGWPVIAAVGGDGTINEVINGVAPSRIPLAVIPAGTGNDLVRSLKLPKSWSEAVLAITSSKELKIDLGEDQGCYFASLAGMGFPADVMNNVNLSKGIFSGSMAFVWGILRTLRKLSAIPVRLDLDGEIKTQKVQGIFILNTAYAGGGLKFSPQADYNDGKLDVVVMRDLSVSEIMWLLPKVYRGTHLSHPKVDFYRVRDVKVETTEPLHKLFDGNVHGSTPIKATVHRGALRVKIL